MATKRRINCPYCDFFCRDMDLFVSHIEGNHSDEILPGMDPWQFVFYLRNNKTHGTCLICKKDTTWNEKTHKYNKLCGNPVCKDKYIQMFKNRMIHKYGKTTLLNDPEQQKKMLANRSISGKYVWSDHINTMTYTGSYEKAFLEFLDLTMGFDAKDIITPSPHTYYYEYEGKKHFYIPDVFIVSLDLEIEIKDGGDNPNTHHKIVAVDKEKEKLKDDVVKTSSFNYIKIANKEHMKFLKYLDLAKEYAVNGNTSKIFMV